MKDQKLLTALRNDAKPGTEEVMVSHLTARQQPISIADLAKAAGVAPGAISQARRRVNDYLAGFCATKEPLSTIHTVIQVPQCEKSKKTRYGYHLAFYNTKEQRILTSEEAISLRERACSGRIESLLKSKLKKEAADSSSEKLAGRDDYQPLELEIGIFDDEQPIRGSVISNRGAETREHQRVWRFFELASLHKLKGQCVLASETGTGKTTFLRHLQLRMLEEGKWLPIFLDAAEIEQWAYKGVTALLERIVDHMELECERQAVVGYLKARCVDRVLLLIDGLDQIRGVGTAYERFVTRLLRVCREGGITLLIASRPTAVVYLEGNRNISFLRLKPLSQRMQRRYFAEHYSRSRELCRRNPDLTGIPMLAYMMRSLVDEVRKPIVADSSARAVHVVPQVQSLKLPLCVCFMSSLTRSLGLHSSGSPSREPLGLGGGVDESTG